jgi:hypothetical protein
MWKYQCKTQFFSLVISFVIGCVLSSFFYFMQLDTLTGELSEAVTTLIGQYSPLVVVISGGFSLAGIVNVVIMAQMVMNQFRISPFLIFLICMFAYEYIYMLGVILVIPMMGITLYGWLSLRNMDKKLLRRANISNDEELVRIYKIHHPMVESVEPLARTCRANMNRITSIYALGVLAILCVLLFVDNAIFVMIAILFYMFTLNFLIRYRASQFLPISNLLYQQCNPQACASALIYFCTNKKGKVKLRYQSLLAQCLIYMDDPNLAQDVLITYPRKDAGSILMYWSLMAHIDYMLKDEDGLLRCKEEASKVNIRFGRNGIMAKNAEMASIENRINLMNSDFNACKKYYLNVYNSSPLPYEKIDAAYYIGLISFVQQDYPVAKLYFERVAAHGNTMYFKAKAEYYLEKLSGMHLEIE